jgi:hypothetical protein
MAQVAVAKFRIIALAIKMLIIKASKAAKIIMINRRIIHKAAITRAIKITKVAAKATLITKIHLLNKINLMHQRRANQKQHLWQMVQLMMTFRSRVQPSIIYKQ